MLTWLTTEDLFFPDPRLSDDDGLLAVGGDLSVKRLIKAYSMGIFPWFEKGSPILWWSPLKRMILYPEKFKISHSLMQTLKKDRFKVTFDKAFKQVITACSKVNRKGQQGTWITNDMKSAYIAFHKAGYAHSVETWQDDQLVGGLYGIALGSIFCGESMFHNVPDASKVAMFNLVENLKRFNFSFIDAQVHTPHLQRLGGEMMERDDFLALLRDNNKTLGMGPSWKTFQQINCSKMNETG